MRVTRSGVVMIMTSLGFFDKLLKLSLSAFAVNLNTIVLGCSRSSAVAKVLSARFFIGRDGRFCQRKVSGAAALI